MCINNYLFYTLINNNNNKDTNLYKKKYSLKNKLKVFDINIKVFISLSNRNF